MTDIRWKKTLSMCVLVGSFAVRWSLAQASEKRPVISLAERAVDTQEVQNVMGRQAYYHAVSRHREEWAALWTKRDDITFAENTGWIVGRDKIFKYYVEMNEESLQKDLDDYRKSHPEVPDSKEYWGVGNFIIHPLTTGVIEIAGDGKTAKGLWYSPGAVTVRHGATASAFWLWEKVGADLVKEDGQWKIWHLTMYNDIMTPVGTSWADSDAAKTGNVQSQGPLTSAGGDKNIGPAPMKLDVPIPYYEHYSVDRKMIYIKPPEPYYTFSETFSYGPPGNK